MRPSSSPSDDLFAGVLARGAAPAQVSGRAWLQALLDAEAALARALAASGVIADAEADAVTAACRAEDYDVRALSAAATGIGNPVGPLVDALRERAGEAAHRGATSQDILDTAAMLVARRALAPLLADLAAAADAAAALAAAHRDTLMAGRTLLQQAVPVTFGFVAAGWMTALDEAAARLRSIPLAAELGGAAGTLAAYGEHGLAVRAAYARELGLEEPAMPWHALRGRVGELAGALAGACGAAGKAARDVTLLAQTEVAEVREAAPGGSTAMAHKANPIAAVCALGCALQAPGLAVTLLAAAVAEHQRAAGAWHAEWRALSGLLATTGSAAAWLRACLEGLEVDGARMRANLDSALGDDPGLAAALVDRALGERPAAGIP